MSNIYRIDNQESAIASNVLNYASASTVNLNNNGGGGGYTPIFQQAQQQHSVISTQNDASNNLSYASNIPVDSTLNQNDVLASRALQTSASFLLPQNRSMTSLVAANQNVNGSYALQDASSSFGLSAVEAAILRSSVPIDINETEEITVSPCFISCLNSQLI